MNERTTPGGKHPYTTLVGTKFTYMGENNGSDAVGYVLCKDGCCKPLYYESIVNGTTRSHLW